MDILVSVQRIEPHYQHDGTFVPKQTVRHYVTIPDLSPIQCLVLQALVIVAGFVFMMCLP